MQTFKLLAFGCSIGLMENKMETTIVYRVILELNCN